MLSLKHFKHKSNRSRSLSANSPPTKANRARHSGSTLAQTVVEDYDQSHPLRRFPPELLEEIFQYCQEEHEDLSLNRPPWYLLHICQLWRQVALRMSDLWRHFPPITYLPKSKRPNISKLHFLLQHSSNAKITFLLYQTEHLIPYGVIPLLLRNCHRWERVALHISDYVCEVLARCTLGRLPSLTTLTIGTQSLKRPHELFSDAPKLRTVRYTSFVDQIPLPAPFTVLSGRLPWNLTSFTSHTIHLDTQTLLKVFANSKTLEKLDLALRGWPADAWHQIPPTTLPSLTSLALRFLHGPQIHQSILSNLTLPCLAELFIGLYPPSRLSADLTAMITRSMCTLQHLTLQSSLRHLQWNIADVLKLIPQLKSLDVNDSVDQRLAETLCSWNQAEGWAFVPFLETLTLHTEGSYDLGRLAVTRCELAGERLQIRQRLENLVVVSSSPFVILEDLRVPADSKHFLEHLESVATLMQRHDFVATSSALMDDFLWFAKGITDANEILYLYYKRINIPLWTLFSSMPLKLRIALDLRNRLETVFIDWANVVVNSSSPIPWLWDKHGHLKYFRDTPENRAFLFFRLKRAFLEEDWPVNRNFPYDEDERPVPYSQS